jgi:hypothetical protein
MRWGGKAALPLVLLLSAAAPAHAQAPVGGASKPALALSATPDPHSPTGIAVPGDLAAAVAELRRILPAEAKAALAGDEPEGTGPDADLGQWIRTNWGLWQNSLLSRWFQEQGVHAPDDMAAVVLAACREEFAGRAPDIAILLEKAGVRSLPADSLPAVEEGEGRKKQTLHRFEGWGYAVDLAPAALVRVQERDRGGRDGFALAFFFPATAGGKQLLGIYAGGRPSFPAGVPAKVRIRKGTFAGAPAEWSEWKHDGRWHREIKVELPGRFPAYLHLWYHDLGDSQRREAEKILSRLRLWRTPSPP